MMTLNARPSELAAIVAQLSPASAAPGTVTTGRVDMAAFETVMFIVQAGALGAAATLDGKLQQFLAASGGTGKDVSPGHAMVQMTKADSDDNKLAIITVRREELDIEAGYRYVGASATVAAAASTVGIIGLGFGMRHGLGTTNDLAAVDSVAP